MSRVIDQLEAVGRWLAWAFEVVEGWTGVPWFVWVGIAAALAAYHAGGWLIERMKSRHNGGVLGGLVAVLLVAIVVLGWLTHEQRKELSDLRVRTAALMVAAESAHSERQAIVEEMGATALRVGAIGSDLANLKRWDVEELNRSLDRLHSDVEGLRGCINRLVSGLQIQSGVYIFC